MQEFRIFACMRRTLIFALVLVPGWLKAQSQVADSMAMAAPIPDTVVIRQFDGTNLHVVCSGNAPFVYCETTDGYTLVMDKVGVYEYAKKSGGGDLKPDGTTAKDEKDRTTAEKLKVGGIHKHLRYTGAKLKELLAKQKKENEDPAIIKRHKLH